MSTPTGKKGAAPLTMKERWQELPARIRWTATLSGVVLVILMLSWAVMSTEKRSALNTTRGRIDNALMVDANRDLSAAGVASDIRDFRQRVRELENENTRMRAMVDRMQSSSESGGASVEGRLQSEVADLRRMVAEMQQGRGAATAQPHPQGGGTPSAPAAPVSSTPTPVGVGPVPGDSMPPPQPAYGGIRTIKEEPRHSDAQATPAADKRPDLTRFYLPSGTMITGVLLAGVDAPTGRAALKDPIPVLARIKHDAILPNRYRADVKECFALLESSGDLASERAMMRMTNISCVRKDRSVIDVGAVGYAVGEDGRAGLRGRLVSKQGQVLAKAMMAGFAEGLSSAFGGNRRNQMLGGAGVLDVDYGSVPERGALGGASSALDRIAAYYLDLADQLHPTVEIDAGRRVTIVLLKGRDLASLDSKPTR